MHSSENGSYSEAAISVTPGLRYLPPPKNDMTNYFCTWTYANKTPKAHSATHTANIREAYPWNSTHYLRHLQETHPIEHTWSKEELQDSDTSRIPWHAKQLRASQSETWSLRLIYFLQLSIRLGRFQIGSRAATVQLQGDQVRWVMRVRGLWLYFVTFCAWVPEKSLRFWHTMKNESQKRLFRRPFSFETLRCSVQEFRPCIVVSRTRSWQQCFAWESQLPGRTLLPRGTS